MLNHSTDDRVKCYYCKKKFKKYEVIRLNNKLVCAKCDYEEKKKKKRTLRNYG